MRKAPGAAKTCGVAVTTPVSPSGEVEFAAIDHRPGCAFIARLGNNPGLS